MGQGRVTGHTKLSTWKFQLKGRLHQNITCAIKTAARRFWCVSTAHMSDPYLSYNALNVSKFLVLRYEVRILRACNSLCLSTHCCQQLKASGRLFLSSFWLLSHNVMMPQCCLLVIRVKGYLLRDICIYLYIFPRGCPCQGSFQCATVITSSNVLFCLFIKGISPRNSQLLHFQRCWGRHHGAAVGTVVWQQKGQGFSFWTWGLCVCNLCVLHVWVRSRHSGLLTVQNHSHQAITFIGHFVGAGDCVSVLHYTWLRSKN